MTAEVVVMNKHAIAIAADSAMTVTNPFSPTPKIHNSVNKIFQISHNAPVAVMIYGSAEFGGIPWETVIKMYRAKLADKRFATIEEYRSDLVQYLDALPYDQKMQEANVSSIVSSFFIYVAKGIKTAIGDFLDEFGEIPKEDIYDVVDGIVNNIDEEVNNEFAQNPGFGEKTARELVGKYKRQIYGLRRNILDRTLPISREAKKTLYIIAANSLIKDMFSPSLTGLVVAGFGEDDMFPSLVESHIDGKIDDILKIRHTRVGKIEHGMEASVMPFAQSEMVYRFMEGVDPEYQELLQGASREILRGLAVLFTEKYIKRKTTRESVLKELHDHIEKLMERFEENVQKTRNRLYVRPTIQAVRSLPKDELGRLAEALVQLTSLKRKMSVDLETVGEPIDVAVISKGDGFVWIKRKHYFDPSLNPRWLHNYVTR